MNFLISILRFYRNINLMLRILIGLLIGAGLGLTVPGLTFVSILGKLFVGALKAIAPILVALLVASETENKRRDILPEESWQIRKAESLDLLHYTDSHDVRILWLADKRSNMRSFHRMYVEKGNAMWVDFHQQDPEKQGWYYRKVLEYTAALAHTTAYQEYRFLINKVFGEVKHGDD